MKIVHINQNDAWSLVDYYMQPISHFFNEDGVTEICVNRFDEIYVERYGKMERVDLKFSSEGCLNTLVTQIANALGQVADKDSHPILDGRIPNGSRICAVMNPTAPFGTNLTIRVFPKKAVDSEVLLKNGSLNEDMLEFLRIAMLTRSNILVSGGTGSGKTTLLNILSAFIPQSERVITVEDTQELQISVKNHIALEAPQRRKTAGDAQNLDMAFLIKTTLRMKPDRIIVGEIRDDNAAMSFLYAINTGHKGTCSTIHANNPNDAIVRLQTMVAGAGKLPYDVVKPQVRSNLNVIIQTEDIPGYGRRIVSLCELKDGEIIPLWDWIFKNKKHKAHKEAIDASETIQKAQEYGIKNQLTR